MMEPLFDEETDSLIRDLDIEFDPSTMLITEEEFLLPEDDGRRSPMIAFPQDRPASPFFQPPLTYGACRFMGYQASSCRSLGPVVLQVYDCAKLKYASRGNEMVQYETDLPYTVYRFILSDGSHLAPARMHTERDRHQGEPTPLLDLDHLVRQGELAASSIVEVTPRPGTGDNGLMQLLDLKVIMPPPREAPVHFIRCCKSNELVPIHGNVLAFSPSGKHHCTIPVNYNRINADPLPREVLLLAQAIESRCGYCTIAGIACLDKYIHDLKGCRYCYSDTVKHLRLSQTPCDIELYVPDRPRSFAQSQSHQRQVPNDTPVDLSHFAEKADLPGSLKDLYESYRICHTKLQVTSDDVTNYGTGSGWMNMFVGLYKSYEFQLILPDNTLLSPKIHVSIINAVIPPGSPCRSWADLVASSFDIDISQCYAEITTRHTNRLNHTPTVDGIHFLDRSLRPCETGQFSCSVKPCDEFSKIFDRIARYQDRGFELRSLTFDERCTPDWQEHFEHYYQSQIRARDTQSGYEGYHGITLDDHARCCMKSHPPTSCREEANDRVPSNMKNSPPRPRGFDVASIFLIRKAEQLMVRRHLESTGGNDPSGNAVNITKLIRLWKVSNKALRCGQTVPEFLKKHRGCRRRILPCLRHHTEPQSDSETDAGFNTSVT